MDGKDKSTGNVMVVCRARPLNNKEIDKGAKCCLEFNKDKKNIAINMASELKRELFAGFGPRASSALLRHSWPGNVRELRNVLERAAVLAGDAAIEPAHLALPQAALPQTEGAESLTSETSPTASPSAAPPSAASPTTAPPSTAPRSLREVERKAVEAALAFTDGHRGEAARLLGVSEPTLRRKLRAYGLDPASDAG